MLLMLVLVLWFACFKLVQLDREHISEYCKRVLAKGPDGCPVSDDEEGEE